MTEETTVTSATDDKPKRTSVATTTWFNAKGEAESPMDDVTKVTFALDTLQGRSWSLDLSDARAAMEAAGLPAVYINKVLAYSGFGFKTKQTNEASGVRNNPKLADSEKTPEAQGAALDEYEAELEAGNWRASRGEGESLPGVGDLAEAIVRVQKAAGKTPDLEAIKANVAKADKETRAKYRNNADVKAALLAIRAERAAAKAGTQVKGAATADDILAVA